MKMTNNKEKTEKEILIELDENIDVIKKLLYMQTKTNIEALKESLVKTDKQMKLYESLDGNRTMEDLHKLTGVSIKTMEPLLPQWEKNGLVLSFGKGRAKRYLSLDNLEI